jgi:hypothetical protein
MGSCRRSVAVDMQSRMTIGVLETTTMPDIKGYRLYVSLGASQVRKRLKGVGYGVRKVETAGKGQALIIHTATGDHRRKLCALFEGLIERSSEEENADE